MNLLKCKHLYLSSKILNAGNSIKSLNPTRGPRRVLEHLGYEELAERYVKPTGRKLVSTPLERMVYAEKL